MNKLFLIYITLSYSNIYAQELGVYQIKEGDTISQLLRGRVHEGSLYGDDALVSQNLKLNRLNLSNAKKLKVGSYIILPKKQEPITDVISTGLSASSRAGLLSTNISSHQKVEFNIKFSQKELDYDGGGKANLKKNYDAGIKVIGNNKKAPTLGIIISNASSVEFEKNKNLLVDIKPGFELYSSVNTFSFNRLTIGPLLSYSEYSNIDYNSSENFFLRRDQNIWIGVQASSMYSFDNFNMVISGLFKVNPISKNLENRDTINLIKSNLELKVNLTKDYFMSSFIDFETGDRTSSALGLNFIYQI